MAEAPTAVLEPKVSEYEQLRDELEMVFSFYLPDDVKNKAKQEQVRVISIGCGQAHELTGLSKVLPNSYIEAIDIDKAALIAAKAWNPDFNPDQLKIADATDLNTFGEEPWDMVLIRNPRPGHLDEILSNSVESLKPEGILFITNPSEMEQRDTLDDIANKDKLLDPFYVGPIAVPMRSKFPNHEEEVAVFRKK